VKDLMLQIQKICDALKDENEIAIIEKYNYNAKRYTILFTSKTTCIILCLIFKLAKEKGITNRNMILWNIFSLKNAIYTIRQFM